MLDYKWNTYAARTHMMGWFFHLTYVIALMVYINDLFLVDPSTLIVDNVKVSPKPNERILMVVAGCLVYPTFYDGTQAIKQGFEYFSDMWNYLDLLHIIVGYGNLYLQWKDDPWKLTSKLTMIVVILISLLKTFFFLRIRMSFSYIVTMITSVVIDLRVFLLFFFILILMFSAVFDVISRNDQPEYQHIGPFVGNFMTTLRLSLGDFQFDILSKGHMDQKEHFLFWVIWVMMVLFSALIFLNFIIAEVSNSYQKVKENIDALIYKERASLVMEAEDIMSASTKRVNKRKFPAYIIIREMEV